jgi:hypothetical protein
MVSQQKIHIITSQYRVCHNIMMMLIALKEPHALAFETFRVIGYPDHVYRVCLLDGIPR